MAFVCFDTMPLMMLLLAYVVLAASRGERDAARCRVFIPTLLAAMLVIWVIKAALHANGGEITGMVRWKRLLVRGGLLLSVGLNAVCSFLALGTVADKLLGEDEGSSFSSVSVRTGCAIVAAFAHHPLAWSAVAGM